MSGDNVIELFGGSIDQVGDGHAFRPDEVLEAMKGIDAVQTVVVCLERDGSVSVGSSHSVAEAHYLLARGAAWLVENHGSKRST